MAVVRARSTPPYGLFSVLAIAVIAIVAAVIFSVMWSGSVEERDQATARLAVFLGNEDADRMMTSVLGSDFRKGPPASQQLISMINTLKADLARDQARIDQLARDNARKDGEIKSFNTAATSANDRAVALAKSVGDIQSAFNKQVDDLQTINAKVQQELASTGTDRDRRVSEHQKALSDALLNAEEERRRLVLQLEDSQSQIAKLTVEILELRVRIINSSGGGNAGSDVGEADGRIILVNGATGEVYINLTKKDRLMPGMPFTAYDPRIGVRYGTDEAALGNGSLEVIEVGEQSTLCRITRTTPNRAIQADDMIANLVFHNDRTRKYRFTVFGDFDLDGDGVATAAERDRLVVLVQRWGGQVDDDVTSQTDYLVLGTQPKAPLIQMSEETALTEPATDPAIVPGSVAEVRAQDQDRYETLEISAKRLAIPVLNANRFLAMVGYYNTTVVRY